MGKKRFTILGLTEPMINNVSIIAANQSGRTLNPSRCFHSLDLFCTGSEDSQEMTEINFS